MKFENIESMCNSIRKCCMRTMEEDNDMSIEDGEEIYWTPERIDKITNYLADNNNVLTSVMNRVDYYDEDLLVSVCEDGLDDTLEVI